MTSHRQERISELLQEELSLLIGAELTDPRLANAMVTVTSVRVSPDLRNARVSVAHSLPEAQTREVVAALRHAESFLRSQLVANLALRFVPELSFHVDATDVYAQRVDQILDSIVTSTHAQEGYDNDSATVPSDDDAGPSR